MMKFYRQVTRQVNLMTFEKLITIILVRDSRIVCYRQEDEKKKEEEEEEEEEEGGGQQQMNDTI